MDRRKVLKQIGGTALGMTYANILAQAFTLAVKQIVKDSTEAFAQNANTEQYWLHLFFNGGTYDRTSFTHLFPNGDADLPKVDYESMGFFNMTRNGKKVVETMFHNGVGVAPFWRGDIPTHDGKRKPLADLLPNYLTFGPALLRDTLAETMKNENHPEASVAANGNHILINGTNALGRIATATSKTSPVGGVELARQLQPNFHSASGVILCGQQGMGFSLQCPTSGLTVNGNGELFFSNNQVNSLMNQSLNYLKQFTHRQSNKGDPTRVMVDIDQAKKFLNTTADVLNAYWNQKLGVFSNLMSIALKGDDSGLPGITTEPQIVNQMYARVDWDQGGLTNYPPGVAPGGDYRQGIGFHSQLNPLHMYYATLNTLQAYRLVGTIGLGISKFQMWNTIGAGAFQIYASDSPGDPHYDLFDGCSFKNQLMARAHLACLNEHIRSIQANGVDNVYCIINREFECQPQANFGALNGSGLKNTGFQHDGKAWNAQVLSPMIGEHSPVCGDFNKRAYRYNPISYPGTHPNAATYSELGGRHVTSRDFWSMVEWIATGSSPLGQQPFLEWKNGKLYRKQAFRRNPKVYA